MKRKTKKNAKEISLEKWGRACNKKLKIRKIQPLHHFFTAGDQQKIKLGEEALKKGSVGCLIAAGGVGSRLGYKGPKGTFPLDHQGTTLFKIHCKKILNTTKKFGHCLPIAIMTSEDNDLATREYFKKNDYFGLREENLHFFKQRSLPYLDEHNNPITDENGCAIMGPNGNGELLHLFGATPFYESWKELGVKTVTTILVDNALAEPFDPELIGFHLSHHDEITVKAIERQNASEKVGVLVEEENKIRIIEYSEISQEEAEAVDDQGKLKYPLANISLFAFSLEFIERVVDEEMPLHASWKAISPGGPQGWKLETFIFDLLEFTDRVNILVYPRESCFAPLKSKEDITKTRIPK